MHVAAFVGSSNVVSKLIENKADPNATNIRGETPLHLAAKTCQPDVISALLRNGADVNAKSKVSEETRLMYLRSFQSIRYVRSLQIGTVKVVGNFRSVSNHRKVKVCPVYAEAKDIVITSM